MAALESTTWGSIVGGSSAYPTSYGKIGIYTSVTNTNTQTTIKVQVWFWSKYGVDDSYNSYYYNNLSSTGSATTEIWSSGDKTIKTTVSTGSGWSTSNQVKLGERTYTYSRDTSAKTRYLYAKLVGIDAMGGTMYANKTVSIPALAKFTITYDANGGSGAPGKQTKYYGKDLTISSTKPTRTGYSFQGWSLTKNGSVYYTAGSTCGKNENLTLYAVWKANTYTVSYNANGGSGAPSTQTKTYGVTLKLSTTKPTRTNYNFLGWSTSASAATATYAAGGNYTANSGVTLYAVWQLAYKKPRITGLTAYRPNDTSGSVKFSWACDKTVSSILIELKPTTGSVISKKLTPTTLNGSVDQLISSNLSAEATYAVTVTVTDANGKTVARTTLPGSKFPIDVLAKGAGISFNKPAEREGYAEFAFRMWSQFGDIMTTPRELPTGQDLNHLLTPGYYIIGDTTSSASILNKPPFIDSSSNSTAFIAVIPMGNDIQRAQIYTVCSKEIQLTFQRINYSNAWSSWVIKDGCTGWRELTLSSDFAIYNDESWRKPKYKVNGNIVSIKGTVSPKTSYTSSTTMKTIATGIPKVFCPDYTMAFICQGSGLRRWALQINTNGEIGETRSSSDAVNYATLPTSEWMIFNVSYSI